MSTIQMYPEFIQNIHGHLPVDMSASEQRKTAFNHRKCPHVWSIKCISPDRKRRR